MAPTLEPAAAVNLEYLLLALKVRKTAKREPLFSLDPVDPQNLETCRERPGIAFLVTAGRLRGFARGIIRMFWYQCLGILPPVSHIGPETDADRGEDTTEEGL